MKNAAVKGVMQTVAGAATMPLFAWNYQPGKYQNVNGVRKFVIDPHFPNGVDMAIPAWLGALLGIPLLMRFIPGMKGMFGSGGNWRPGRFLRQLQQDILLGDAEMHELREVQEGAEVYALYQVWYDQGLMPDNDFFDGPTMYYVQPSYQAWIDAGRPTGLEE